MSSWDTFLSLPQPSAPGCYTVEHGTGTFRVGRSFDGHPTLLVEFAEPDLESLARRLANLSYSPPAMVDLARGDGVRQVSRLAILECLTNEEALGTYFYRVAWAILVDNPRARDQRGFENALDALAALFQALQLPALKTIQGLWAELAIILWAKDPVASMSSWHSSPRALHDFAAGTLRLEVKSSLKGLREHAFILDQLTTVGSGATVIASILLQESERGASLTDLVQAIALRVGPGSAARLEAIVGTSLGDSWHDALDTRFLLDTARASLRLYDASCIPTIPQPLPPEVKDIRFTVDLSSVSDLDLEETRALGDFFDKVLPGP